MLAIKKNSEPSNSPSCPPDAVGESLDCKIVVLTHYLPPYMERVLFHLSRQVRELKVLLSIREEPNRDYGADWDDLDVDIQRSLMIKKRWHHDSGFSDEQYLHFPYDTLSRLKHENPDFVFSYELGFRSLGSALYCKFYKKSLVLCVCVSEHTEKGRSFLRRWLRKFLLRSATAVTYNGPSCKAYLQSYSIPEERLFHFPYAPSDRDSYTGPSLRTPENDHALLYVGQLSERKGVLRMLRGLAEYARRKPDQQIHLSLVGKGPLQSKLQRVELPGNLRVEFLGHINHASVSSVMEKTGILIFPTMADEWGLVVNEALGAGMPVLGSIYSQACTTLLEEHRNGWLYDPKQPESLFAQLDQVFDTDHDRLSTMRLACQESVRQITSQRVADQALHIFTQLAAHNEAR